MYPGRERREFPRLGAAPQTYCRLTIGDVVTFRALAVENVSRSGVRLRVNMPVPVGRALFAFLEDPARGVGCFRTVRVVYCVEDGRGEYALGGCFDQGLSPSDVEALTATAPAQPIILRPRLDPDARQAV